MDYEGLNGCPQRSFPQQDQPFQTGLFDAATNRPAIGKINMGYWISVSCFVRSGG
jgi:hypothetical protein